MASCCEVHCPQLEGDDPDLAINWPVKDPIISERDRNNPSLREVFDGKETGDLGAANRMNNQGIVQSSGCEAGERKPKT